MTGLNVIMNLLILILLALGGYVLMATRAAVKTGAEEAAKAAIRQLQWPAELTRELQKTRGVERQELRFKSYGGLWKELRPLAIYDDAVIDKKKVDDLSSKLSTWYFSECGGLLLTPQARDFYFSLQDLLRTALRIPEEWRAARFEEPKGGYKVAFRAVLDARSSREAISVLDYFSEGKFENWQEEASDLGKKWKEGIKKVAAAWNELNEKERFATLQQVGSKLRTSLVTDLESRLL
jgi:hypothetical protein